MSVQPGVLRHMPESSALLWFRHWDSDQPNETGVFLLTWPYCNQMGPAPSPLHILLPETHLRIFVSHSDTEGMFFRVDWQVTEPKQNPTADCRPHESWSSVGVHSWLRWVFWMHIGTSHFTLTIVCFWACRGMGAYISIQSSHLDSGWHQKYLMLSLMLSNGLCSRERGRCNIHYLDDFLVIGAPGSERWQPFHLNEMDRVVRLPTCRRRTIDSTHFPWNRDKFHCIHDLEETDGLKNCNSLVKESLVLSGVGATIISQQTEAYL